MNRLLFIQRGCDFGKEKSLWSPGAKILVAVSGGPDSLALLLFFHTIQEREGISVGCVCVQHHLRKEAEKETRFVQGVCEGEGIPFYRRDVYVREEQAQNGGSLETVARQLRYDALFHVMENEGYTQIATAHHADDQAETVLYRLLRGSGVTGLSGIHPRRGGLIRPFLRFRKKEIQSFLQTFPYIPCHDATNDIPDTDRNKIRLEVMPFLQKYGFDTVSSLCRTAEVVCEENRYMEEKARDFFEQHCEETGGKISLDRKVYLMCPLALRRRVLRFLYENIVKKERQTTFTFEGTERIDQLIFVGHMGKQTSAGGMLVDVQGATVLFYEGDTHYGPRNDEQ